MWRAWLIALCGCRSILGIEEAMPITPPPDAAPVLDGFIPDGFQLADARPDASTPGPGGAQPSPPDRAR